MTIDPVFYLQASAADAPIPEFSVVALGAALALGDARILPAGSEGTVVGLWGDGEGYVVEFDTPFHTIATVEGGSLREVARFEA